MEVVSQGPPMAHLIPRCRTAFTLPWPPQTSVVPPLPVPLPGGQVPHLHSLKMGAGSHHRTKVWEPPLGCSGFTRTCGWHRPVLQEAASWGPGGDSVGCLHFVREARSTLQ